MWERVYDHDAHTAAPKKTGTGDREFRVRRRRQAGGGFFDSGARAGASPSPTSQVGWWRVFDSGARAGGRGEEGRGEGGVDFYLGAGRRDGGVVWRGGEGCW